MISSVCSRKETCDPYIIVKLGNEVGLEITRTTVCFELVSSTVTLFLYVLWLNGF